MNILIVDKDKKLADAISNIFYYSGQKHNIYYYSNENVSSLKENQVTYDVKLISIDKIDSNNFSFILQNGKTIAISPDIKTTKKIINNPYIQKVFQKPVDISNIINYLQLYCGISMNNEDKTVPLIEKLRSIGFSMSSMGTLYLAECIIEAHNTLFFKVNDICKIVGNKNNVSAEVILWNIQNSINRIIKTYGEDAVCKKLKIFDNRKPTPKYVIEFFSAYLNN